MTIYRNNNDKKLYWIEHLIIDLRFCNRNAFAGIHAYPYCHQSDVIILYSKDENECTTFVDNNFTAISFT